MQANNQVDHEAGSRDLKHYHSTPAFSRHMKSTEPAPSSSKLPAINSKQKPPHPPSKVVEFVDNVDEEIDEILRRSRELRQSLSTRRTRVLNEYEVLQASTAAYELQEAPLLANLSMASTASDASAGAPPAMGGRGKGSGGSGSGRGRGRGGRGRGRGKRGTGRGRGSTASSTAGSGSGGEALPPEALAALEREILQASSSSGALLIDAQPRKDRVRQYFEQEWEVEKKQRQDKGKEGGGEGGGGEGKAAQAEGGEGQHMNHSESMDGSAGVEEGGRRWQEGKDSSDAGKRRGGKRQQYGSQTHQPDVMQLQRPMTPIQRPKLIDVERVMKEYTVGEEEESKGNGATLEGDELVGHVEAGGIDAVFRFRSKLQPEPEEKAILTSIDPHDQGKKKKVWREAVGA